MMNGTSKGRVSVKSWPSRSASTSSKPESGGVAPAGACAAADAARQEATRRARPKVLQGELCSKVRFKPPPAQPRLGRGSPAVIGNGTLDRDRTRNPQAAATG